MNAADQWQESNGRQLAAALASLRDRLERFVKQQSSSAPKPVVPKAPAAPPPPAADTMSRTLFQRLLRGTADKPTEAAADSAAKTATPDAAAQPSASQPARMPEPPSALDMLGDRLGLSPFERNVLLLCAALELDTRIAGLCARAQDDPQKPYPTFGLALALFDEPSWDALIPERPLRFWHLIELHHSPVQPLTASPLRADERVVSYLKGLNYLDERLFSFLSPLELASQSVTLADSQARLVDMILLRWKQSPADGLLPVAQLVGPDPISKQLVAYHAAGELKLRLYRLNAEALPATPGELELLARLWQRENRLLPLALYVDAEDVDAEGSGRTSPLSRFLMRTDGVFFLGVREVMARLGRTRMALDITKPTVTEQQNAWARALGAEAADSPAQLAGQFNLNLPSIEILAARGQLEAKAGAESLPDSVWDACCASERPRMDALAQRIEPKVTWDDLVLPKAEMDSLRQIAGQVGHRNQVYQDWGFDQKMSYGFGISALFAGESGTGKTMASEVIANALRLNLYRIDLSQVVNKYIGETEKNLRRLFDAAQDGGAILFFDEADALFGKRSEVKDSHDRYANIEINYLLQRLESYSGLVILATNMKSAMDTAFLRRLRFIVRFPVPGAADRLRLWNKVFRQAEGKKGESAPPLGELDYARLAKLNLTGGHIHNVALNAAFMAADRNSPIIMPLVLQAARAEIQKLGHAINEMDFRWMESKPALVPVAPSKTAEPVPA